MKRMFDPWFIIGKIVEALGLAPKRTKYRYKQDCRRAMLYLVRIRKLHTEIEQNFQESMVIQLKLGSNNLFPTEYRQLYSRLSELGDIQRKDQEEMDTLQSNLDYIVSKYT